MPSLKCHYTENDIPETNIWSLLAVDTELILKARVFCRNELWFHFMPRLQSESEMQLNLCWIYREAIIWQMSVCAPSTFWARQTALTSSTISSSSLLVDPTFIFLIILKEAVTSLNLDFVTNIKGNLCWGFQRRKRFHFAQIW